MTKQKLVKIASVREHMDAHYRGEISYSKAVDLINKDANKQLALCNVVCHFSYEELQYILVMLTEGQDKINSSKAFEGFQNVKTQETVIEKVKQKCWECHQNGI